MLATEISLIEERELAVRVMEELHLFRDLEFDASGLRQTVSNLIASAKLWAARKVGEDTGRARRRGCVAISSQSGAQFNTGDND